MKYNAGYLVNLAMFTGIFYNLYDFGLFILVIEYSALLIKPIEN